MLKDIDDKSLKKLIFSLLKDNHKGTKFKFHTPILITFLQAVRMLFSKLQAIVFRAAGSI